jgi:hypothetical protein
LDAWPRKEPAGTEASASAREGVRSRRLSLPFVTASGEDGLVRRTRVERQIPAEAPLFRFAQSDDWTEAVFHVLAHVRGTAHLPASVYDSQYAHLVAEHAGAVSERPLGEDVVLLAEAFPDHEALSRAQLVTELFGSTAEAVASAQTDLADLSQPHQTAVLATLAPISRGVELLRCAALLEAPIVETLPSDGVDLNELRSALERVHPASPTLPGYTIVPIRPLRLRGRLVGDQIWTGAPSDRLELTAAHVAWQAAHEASVGEVSRAVRSAPSPSPLSERDIEHVAVVLMAERARDHGLQALHLQWLGHFGAAPTPHRSALSPGALAVITRLTSSGGAD